MATKLTPRQAQRIDEVCRGRWDEVKADAIAEVWDRYNRWISENFTASDAERQVELAHANLLAGQVEAAGDALQAYCLRYV